jgi:hypothetical protein
MTVSVSAGLLVVRYGQHSRAPDWDGWMGGRSLVRRPGGVRYTEVILYVEVPRDKYTILLSTLYRVTNMFVPLAD